MRKITLLLVLTTCISLSTNAQTFSDGSFENCWEFFKNPTAGKQDYWDFKDSYFLFTLNQLHELSGDQGDAPLTAFRDEDAIDGNYSLKLVSKTMTFGEDLFLPGAAGTLSIDFIDLNCILGQPFTHRPTYLKGWYKYSAVKGDSAAIEVFLKKNGNKVGGGKMLIYNDVNAWSEFSVPITYTSNDTPDSLVVIFAASAGYDFSSIETLMECKGQDNSTLYIDDVVFDYEQGIQERLMSEMKIDLLPNPVHSHLSIQAKEPLKGNIVIYDYMGREINRYKINDKSLIINISDYAAGSYLLNYIENGGVMSSKRFIKK